jgi:hypothetical protein
MENVPPHIYTSSPPLRLHGVLWDRFTFIIK